MKRKPPTESEAAILSALEQADGLVSAFDLLDYLPESLVRGSAFDEAGIVRVHITRLRKKGYKIKRISGYILQKEGASVSTSPQVSVAQDIAPQGCSSGALGAQPQGVSDG